MSESVVECAAGAGLQKPEGGGRRQRWNVLRLVWLVYALALFVLPLQEHRLVPWIVSGLVFLCVLPLVLVLSFGRVRHLQVAALIALTGLAGAYAPFNYEAFILFIYVAAFIPFVVDSVRLSIGLILLTAAVAAGEGLLLHASPWAWAIYAVIVLPAGLSNLLVAERNRAHARLVRAHEQIEHLAQEAERERIARDLHDVLGHTLSLIVLKSELAGRLVRTDGAAAAREITDIEQTARKALADVRETIRGYRSDGLAAELDRARQTLALVGVTLECAEPLPQVEPTAAAALTLVLREAITNIVRHARARNCRVSLTVDPRGTALRIEDDGRGGIEREGNGLRGMRERLAALGGGLLVDSSSGTRLTATIPAPSVPASVPA
jgi:two-component system sensor histidine kinase DesK